MTSQEIPALVGPEEGESGEAGQVHVLLVDELRLDADVVDQELAGALPWIFSVTSTQVNIESSQGIRLD